jgi:GMP synthase (glutamine-hydrolysing)
VQVLAFRHSPTDGLGLIGDTLQAHDIECQCADVYAAPSHDVSVADADALIVLGGAMSANDGLEFIHREMECIRTAIGLGKPVLGICLGAQMIAKALGALVYANPTTEIGWAPVQFTQAALSDPVLCGHRCEVIFHWHRETFDLPEGGCLLASSQTSSSTNSSKRQWRSLLPKSP